MRKEDFKNATKEQILVCKEIVKNEGDCYGLDCSKCPFCSNCDIFCDNDKMKSNAEEFLKMFDKPKKKKAARASLKRDEGRKFYNFLKKTYNLEGVSSNSLNSIEDAKSAINQVINQIVIKRTKIALGVLENE